ncbi:hypothetical protein [Bacillus suaedaesalsae]|uniref:Uncharacterized protein n=1 Tax=Bacillus suaedaesalsae TaxID=2810349 RepID=A0ABS2DHN1_9BACI|nr:hypothetical protein [Bacillus suaedaesalsae]MBM6617987.1 hypothetical protein [Bacillus suaedaesalsae]
MKKLISILLLFILVACNTEYSDEIQIAYESLEEPTRVSIKNWKRANVYEIKKQEDFMIDQEDFSDLV